MKVKLGVSLILKRIPPTIKWYLFVLFPYLSCVVRGSLRRSAFLFPFPARPQKKYGYRPIQKSRRDFTADLFSCLFLPDASRQTVFLYLCIVIKK